jgi:predicted O-methyltransferase YrrM
MPKSIVLPIRSTIGALTPELVRKFRRETRQLFKTKNHAKFRAIQFYSGLGNSSYLLYGLARSIKPEVCVEIGSARGNSTCAIGMALKENGHGKLYAIDPHTTTAWNDSNSVQTFEILRNNIAALKLTEQVEIIRSFSSEAASTWTRPIDLLFIDGDHTYEGVKRDWDLFIPHVSPFGVVVFHDTIGDLKPDPEWSRSDMGVPGFVDDLRRQGYQVVTIDQDCGISLVQPVVGGVPLR